jgi:hypothetical protein
MSKEMRVRDHLLGTWEGAQLAFIDQSSECYLRRSEERVALNVRASSLMAMVLAGNTFTKQKMGCTSYLWFDQSWRWANSSILSAIETC